LTTQIYQFPVQLLSDYTTK